jgi:hypothetical protein
MDDANREEAVRSNGRPASGLPPAVIGNKPRIEASRGDSSVRTTAGLQILPGFFNQPIEPAGIHVVLELPVPFVGISLGKPSA